MSGSFGLGGFPGRGRQFTHAIDGSLTQFGQNIIEISPEIDPWVTTTLADAQGLSFSAASRPTSMFRRLIFRKQIFEVVLGQAAGKAGFTENVLDRLGFSLLQFPDFFLNGPG